MGLQLGLQWWEQEMGLQWEREMGLQWWELQWDALWEHDALHELGELGYQRDYHELHVHDGLQQEHCEQHGLLGHGEQGLHGEQHGLLGQDEKGLHVEQHGSHHGFQKWKIEQ